MEAYAPRGHVHGGRVDRRLRRRAGAAAADHRDGEGGRAGGRGDRGAHPAARRGRHHHRRGQLPLPRHQAAHRGVRRQRHPVHGRSACPAARRARSTGRASCPAATPRRTPRSRRSSPRSPRTWTAPRAACTSGRTGRATTSRWCTTASSTPTSSSSPRPTTCSPTSAGSTPRPSARSSRSGTPATWSRSSSRSRRSCCRRPTQTPATPLVDVILDQAEQKGTGRWTARTRWTSGCRSRASPRPCSRARSRRCATSARPRRPRSAGPRPGEGGVPDNLVDDIRQALYASQDRGLRAGLRADAGRVPGQRLGPGPRRHGHDLAGRLHHPGPVPQPDQRGLRRARRHREPA